jgi:primosomal protein N' (replication factor Y)
VSLLRDALPGVKILGPGEPMISKIRNQFLLSILIKISRSRGDLATIKQNLNATIENLMKEKDHRSVRIVVDVDPV